MKILWTVLILAAASLAGWVWIHPLFEHPAPPPPPLASDFVGTFRITDYEPPQGTHNVPNPFPSNQHWYYTFRANGTYMLRRLVHDGYEMQRIEGYVDCPDPHTLRLTPRIDNGIDLQQKKPAAPAAGKSSKQPAAPQTGLGLAPVDTKQETYKAVWESTVKLGRRLVLTRMGEGWQLYLQRVQNGDS